MSPRPTTRLPPTSRDLFGGLEVPAGFWVRPPDAGLALSEVAARGWTLQAVCTACGHGRTWGLDAVARMPEAATAGQFAARLVCGGAGCGSRQGTVAPWRPPRPGDRRRGRLSDRDLARIKAMAAQASEARLPPILDDLDAPIRVGVCLPGQEVHLGAQVVAPWNGRLILGWTLGRKARNRRRTADDWSA